MTDCLEPALDLLRRGYCPIPCHLGVLGKTGYVCTCGKDCHSPGKHPAINWRQFQNTRPTEAQLVKWFTGEHAGLNLGICHGQQIGTLALDWDGADGLEAMNILERELGPLPATPAIITGGGGLHVLFRHPDRHVPTSKALRPGFDVRATGGFSVAPPSLHVSGREYAWDVDGHVEDLPLADLPAAWLSFVVNTMPTHTASVAVQVKGEHKIIDGRETVLRDVVRKVFLQMLQENGELPKINSLIATAWQTYSPLVDLSRPGRGYNELERKCHYILRRYNNQHVPLPLLTPPTFS